MPLVLMTRPPAGGEGIGATGVDDVDVVVVEVGIGAALVVDVVVGVGGCGCGAGWLPHWPNCAWQPKEQY
jgi:hypothetical protein